MPELSITESQQEELEAVRAAVEDTFVDTYGHTTVEDALDYLLDTYTPPDEQGGERGPYDRIASAEYPELQQIASTVDDIPGSGINADEMRGKLLTTLGPAELARRLDGVEVDGAHDGTTAADSGTGGGTNDGTACDGAEGNATDDAGEPEPVGTDGPGTEGTAAGDGERAADATADADDESPSGGDDGPSGVLAAANRLLREHDDKWRKSETSEEPYEVDLPDGTTTGVRTKDDVRQLLFRHY
ncbi:hypothetical protein ACFQL1_13885 [Halomicroarcula sp. GCM10025709]|uniref:hypothetical protein n=1 Tax=Haloarcula TaxID=2237 RepID=UPI0024C2EA7D|nr:hypothetical protein [Halomicroarcula sp. YJ-61-S]